MARVLGIDFGIKRTGLAVTDPLQIIVSGLETVETVHLLDYLKKYLSKEKVDKIVIGYPTHSDGTPTYLEEEIQKLVEHLAKEYPHILIDRQDESFSSALAFDILIKSGAKKSKRRDKSLLDKVSAVVILQKYLKHI